MPDKKLIYFCSWGEQYNQMLHLCLDSLMGHIDETYKILVVSDKFEREGIEIINLPIERGKHNPLLSRTAIRYVAEIDQYDYVYYFDHDVIFHRSLDEIRVDPEKVILSRASSTAMSSPYIKLKEELLIGRENELAINNGLHIVPKKMFKLFFDLYYGATVMFRTWGGNAQQALNYIYANSDQKFDFIKPDQIYFPSDPDHSKFTGKTVLTHFAGQSIENRLKQMA